MCCVDRLKLQPLLDVRACESCPAKQTLDGDRRQIAVFPQSRSRFMTSAVSLKWLALCWRRNDDLQADLAIEHRPILSRDILLHNYRRDEVSDKVP